MSCLRCGGFAVVETMWDGEAGAGHLWVPQTRCINCGWIEDPVIRANRRSPPTSNRLAPRHVTHTGVSDRYDSDESC
jgi:hypothetical protein